MTDVIISDIDGTVLDVGERIRASLREIGAGGDEQAARAADALRGSQRSQFFDVFLTEKYAHLDTPLPPIIESIT